mgnify:FL=1
MEECTIKLTAPIMHGQNEITELTLRPITGKDMLGIKFEFDTGGKMVVDADASFKLGYKLTGIPAPVLSQMIAPDVLNLSIELQSFLASGQWTGRS